MRIQQDTLPVKLQLRSHPQLACYSCKLLEPGDASCRYFPSHDMGLYCDRYTAPECEDCGHIIDCRDYWPYDQGVPLCKSCARHRRCLKGVVKLETFTEGGET